LFLAISSRTHLSIGPSASKNSFFPGLYCPSRSHFQLLSTPPTTSCHGPKHVPQPRLRSYVPASLQPPGYLPGAPPPPNLAPSALATTFPSQCGQSKSKLVSEPIFPLRITGAISGARPYPTSPTLRVSPSTTRDHGSLPNSTTHTILGVASP
jgi:hypothetical protein